MQRAWFGTGTGSRQIDIGVGGYGWGSNRGYSAFLWLHTLFQPKIYATNARVMETTEYYTGRKIYIPSDSQAAIKGPESFQRNSN